MSEYSDITLIECNRGQSIEKQSNNESEPGVFTCRLGEALDLQPGDQVNVENAFVSALGCGGQNIQFKGTAILDSIGNQLEQSFEVTNLDITYDPTSTILGHKTIINASNSSIKKKLVDNKTHFVQQYYKNNNGENMMYLPRRFGLRLNDAPTGPILSPLDDPPDNAYSEYFPRGQFDEVIQDPTSATSGNAEGPGQFTIFNSVDSVYTGKPELNPTKFTLNFSPTGLPVIAVSEEYKVAEVDYMYYQQKNDPTFYHDGGVQNYFKPRTDNKRFTLFIRDKTFKIPTDTNARTNLDYVNSNYGFSPTLAPYFIYNELKELTLPVGYNSPESIEQSLTEQIQATKRFEYQGANDGETYVVEQPERFKLAGENVVSTTQTETYMPIESGGAFHNDHLNWRAIERFKAGGTLSNLTYAQALTWWNSHQYIMVKRPELFIKGRLLNDWSGRLFDNGAFNLIQNDLVYESITNSTPLETNMDFTIPNLKLLRDLFKAQEPYMSELAKPFNVIDENYKNQRFIHMNSYPDNVNDLAVPYNFLGSDGFYGNTDKAWLDPVWHTSTMPVFFRYNKSDEDYDIAVQASTNFTKNTKLTYGFAARSDGNKICLYPGLIGSTLTGWRPELFVKNSVINPGGDHQIMANSVRIGWDYHATSYGNVIMAGLNGLGATLPNSVISTQMPYVYDATTSQWNLGESMTVRNSVSTYGKFISGVDFGNADSIRDYKNPLDTFNLIEYLNMFYIGANNPTIFFDNISGHFGFKNLHTAENTGQEVNAGSIIFSDDDVTEANPLQVVPTSDTAGQECYKINKRFNYVDYSPDLKPYNYKLQGIMMATNISPTFNAPIRAPDTGSIKITKNRAPETIYPANPNVELGAIFDSHSGVYWDIGGTCPEEHFEKSFWGILGFSYEQYNPSSITLDNGRQARIGTKNMFNLELATTNCQVVTTELKQYPMNIWGNNKYSCQLDTPTMQQWVPNGTSASTGWVIPEFECDFFGPKVLALTYTPAIVEQTQSIELRAKNLPKLMTRPYYTIRSNIIDSSRYIGGLKGGNRMPIVAICDKLNGNKDYFFTDAAGLQFMITHPISITDVSISIHDPDGSSAVINDNSSIIFRVSRNKNTNRFNILQQIMAEQQKK